MSNPRIAFQHALTVRNVFARFVAAMEHATPEAMEKYLHEHPDADKSKHTVKKQKDGKPSNDNAPHHAEGVKADNRKQETQKHFDDMKALKSKVDNADTSAKKKFDRAYNKLYEQGETAVKAAEKLLPKVDEESAQVLHRVIADWKRNEHKHAKGAGEHAHEKLLAAEQTWGYATEIDKMIALVTKG